jgi:hypothetical protein
LRFDLLIAVLQLLDDAGELPDLRLKPIDAHDQVRARDLSEAVCPGRRRRLLRTWLPGDARWRRDALAAAENPTEQPGRGWRCFLRR